MDEASKQIARFLEALSAIAVGDDLYRGPNSLRMKLIQRGLAPTRPSQGISVFAQYKIDSIEYEAGLAIGMSVKITPEKQLDFSITLLSHNEGWAIETDVLFDLWPEDEGQKSMRDFPTRQARTMEECVAQLQAAALDLAGCDNVIDEITSAGMVFLSGTP